VPTPPANGKLWCAPCKGGAFQWVRVPPGKQLQPEATGAGMEVTKCLKPPDDGHVGDRASVQERSLIALGKIMSDQGHRDAS
jgi:hypothetical protein